MWPGSDGPGEQREAIWRGHWRAGPYNIEVFGKEFGFYSKCHERTLRTPPDLQSLGRRMVVK